MTPNGRQDENIDDKKISGASQQVGPANPGRRRFAVGGRRIRHHCDFNQWAGSRHRLQESVWLPLG